MATQVCIFAFTGTLEVEVPIRRSRQHSKQTNGHEAPEPPPIRLMVQLEMTLSLVAAAPAPAPPDNPDCRPDIDRKPNRKWTQAPRPASVLRRRLDLAQFTERFRLRVYYDQRPRDRDECRLSDDENAAMAVVSRLKAKLAAEPCLEIESQERLALAIWSVAQVLDIAPADALAVLKRLAERRPCPFVSCAYHLYLDVLPETGSIKYNFPHLEPDQIPETCALDVADRGGILLDELGRLMNVTNVAALKMERAVFAEIREKVDPELARDFEAEMLRQAASSEGD